MSAADWRRFREVGGLAQFTRPRPLFVLLLQATPAERAGDLPDAAWSRCDEVTWVAPLDTQPPGWGEVNLYRVDVLFTGDRSADRPPVHMRGQVR